ncbi:MAG: hypothetical protein MK081_15730 [Flavobacteriales bacterium]|nr:hypothetical protein [Flavobacteriales bacterium]
MIKITKYQKSNSTNPKKKDDYLRIRVRGIDGAWKPFTIAYSATSSQIEKLQDVASEIVRKRDLVNEKFTFDLDNRIQKEIGSWKVRSLFVKAGLLHSVEDMDYSFESVRVGMESFQKKRADKGEITLQTFGKRKDVLVVFQAFLDEVYGSGVDVRSIDRSYIRKFINWRLYDRKVKGVDGEWIDRTVSKSTVQSEKKWISLMFEVLVEEKVIENNPCSKVSIDVASEDERKAVLPYDLLAQIEVFLEATTSDDRRGWYIYWMLTRWLGCRKNESLQLQWKDVYFNAIGGQGAINMPAPKTKKQGTVHRRYPMMTGTGWERVDCGLREALQDEYKRQRPAKTDYVVQGILNLHKSNRKDVNWKFKNPSTTMERLIIDAGFAPWAKLMQNLRVTRENELTRHAKWRPEAIHALIGHSRSTYDSNYKVITDDDYMSVEEESYDAWSLMDELFLYYAPSYAPKFSTKGLKYARKTASVRMPVARNREKISISA